MVLAGSFEALLDTDVPPQSRNGIANLGGKVVSFDLGWLHENGLYMVLGPLVVKRQLKLLHGLEDDPHRLHGITEDDFLEGLTLVARISTLVDQLHLLQDRRLARFSSSCTSISVASSLIAPRHADPEEAS